MNNILFILCLVIVPFSLVAQRGLVNMNKDFDFELETKVYQSYSNFHTAIKPYRYSSVERVGLDLDKVGANFFLNKIINKSYAKKKGLFILPMLSASGTAQFETSTTMLSDYAAGAYLKGFVGEKFSFNGLYRYVGSDLPSYIDSSQFSRQVIPSVGRSTNQGEGVLNAHHWEGYLLYDANQYFSFLLGKGKHFWGDGHRSLFLSDNAASYPYLRIESTFWNVKYVNLYSWHNDFTLGENRNKFSTSHILSWNITKDINLGLFETVVWQGSDTLHNRGFEVTYLNPAIFYRAPEYSLGSADNSMIGANLKFRIKNNNVIYGQVLFDEFYLVEMKAENKWWANKYGLQVGVKLFDVFGVKNLGIQSEFNAVRPFTYSHNTSLQNYGHNNQSLVHPVGANFYESTNFVRYKKGKWYFEEQFNYLLYGQDSSSVSYGGDVFASYASRDGDYGHKIGQGESHQVFFNKVKASYLLLSEINLRAFAEVIYRLDKYDQRRNSTGLFQIGISSLLWNQYKDY